MANRQKLPPRDPEKSCHDWNQWGKSKGGGTKVPPRIYEQHKPQVKLTKKVKRK